MCLYFTSQLVKLQEKWENDFFLTKRKNAVSVASAASRVDEKVDDNGRSREINEALVSQAVSLSVSQLV